MFAALGLSAAEPGLRRSDPLQIFHPAVTVSPAERAQLNRGETLVKSLPAVDGQVAIFAAVTTDVSGQRLVRWVRRIDAMKRGRYAPDVVRFSEPPRIEDLATLQLAEDDLDDLRTCRPGDCGLKLSAEEITTLSHIARERRPGWQREAQQAFRLALLRRAHTYLAHGLEGLPPYLDRRAPVRLDEEFAAILAASSFLPTRFPMLARFLSRYPAASEPDVESFLYWSKEILGNKPVISITHVTLAQFDHGADAAVVSRQVYASHYMAGSLAVTAISGGTDGSRYLLYLNRSRVDVLHGFLGGLVRRIVERRLRSEAGDVVDALRRRLESGDPP